MKRIFPLLLLSAVACQSEKSNNQSKSTVNTINEATEMTCLCNYTADQFSEELAKYDAQAVLISESDYEIEELVIENSDLDLNLSLELENSSIFPSAHGFYIRDGAIGDNFEEFKNSFTFEERSVTNFFNSYSEEYEGMDEYSMESARAFKSVQEIFERLTETQAFKIGPKNDRGRMKHDAGLYLWVLIGKSADGKLVGFTVGSVET